ncbi:hypothetical protein FX276_21135 [Salmonella enterica]|nr:hypothetical protein [Salmonella enterica]
MTALLSQKAQEASPRYRSLLPVGCSPRPVTGQRRPWNNSPTVSSSVSLCRESGLKGVHQKAPGGCIIATAPARSGNAARPVPGRTRDTDHRQHSPRAAPAGAHKKEERSDIL